MLDFYEGWVQIEVDLAVALVLPILTVNPPITPDIGMVGYTEYEMSPRAKGCWIEKYESDTCWIEEGSEGILEDKKTGQNCNLQN